jgi:hypothetical protein
MQTIAAKNQVAPDIAREGAKKRAYTANLAKIVRGESAAGQRLREEGLAQTYKLGRTPIQEVLIALEKKGRLQRTETGDLLWAAINTCRFIPTLRTDLALSASRERSRGNP